MPSRSGGSGGFPAKDPREPTGERGARQWAPARHGRAGVSRSARLPSAASEPAGTAATARTRGVRVRTNCETLLLSDLLSALPFHRPRPFRRSQLPPPRPPRGPAPSAGLTSRGPASPSSPAPSCARVGPGSASAVLWRLSGKSPSVDPGAPPPSRPWGSPRGRPRMARTARLPPLAQASGPAPKNSQACASRLS